MISLTPKDLLAEIGRGALRGIYYLCGAESTAKFEALKRLKGALQADAFNISEFAPQSAPGPAELSSALWSLPVLSPKRLVVLDNIKLSGECRKALLSYLEDPSPQTVLAVLTSEKKPDPRDEIVKSAAAAGAAFCAFSPLKEEEAVEFLKSRAAAAGKKISHLAARVVVAEAGTDTLALTQELDKLVTLSIDRPEIGTLEVGAGFGSARPYDPFALARAISNRSRTEALAALEETLAQGRPEAQAFKALFQISAAVTKQFKAKKMLGAGRTQEQIFQALRLHPYWDKGYLDALSRVPTEALAKALSMILRVEADLKSKSWLDPGIELKTLLGKILPGRGRQEAATADAAG